MKEKFFGIRKPTFSQSEIFRALLSSVLMLICTERATAECPTLNDTRRDAVMRELHQKAFAEINNLGTQKIGIAAKDIKTQVTSWREDSASPGVCTYIAIVHIDEARNETGYCRGYLEVKKRISISSGHFTFGNFDNSTITCVKRSPPTSTSVFIR